MKRITICIIFVLTSFLVVNCCTVNAEMTRESVNQDDISHAFNELKTVKASIALYYTFTNKLPNSLADLTKPAGSGDLKIDSFITDFFLIDRWGEKIQYSIKQDHYMIWSKGPDGINKTNDDIILKGSSVRENIMNEMQDMKTEAEQGLKNFERFKQLESEGKTIEEIEKILKREQGSQPLDRSTADLLDSRKRSNKEATEMRKVVTESAAKADIRAKIGTALKLYKIDNNTFPTTKEGLEELVKAPKTAKNSYAPYLQDLPKDPWGNQYIYVFPSNTKKGYELFSCGPDGKKNTEDDIK